MLPQATQKLFDKKKFTSHFLQRERLSPQAQFVITEFVWQGKHREPVKRKKPELHCRHAPLLSHAEQPGTFVEQREQPVSEL